MRFFPFIVLSGVAVGSGAGIALAAVAGADTGTSPIDTWLYADSGNGVNTLPGVLEGYAPGSTQENPFTFDTPAEGIGHPSVPWYTADINTFGPTTATTVEKILDPSFGYPTVGTVGDQTVVNIPVNLTAQPPDIFNLYTDNHITDPSLGTGDYTSMFDNSFTNFYVSDAAGIEDQVTFFGGQSITVFDFPAADTPGADLF
ncbi:hypothetical protein KIH27_05785 [Mycobacterium sp. M1]|uniref:Uncharacterized protein n=1 Tax=Mycolicibacter acidiphilus TaxID=2835306 RepID=A0ABS5RG07_9MYCO|nr:hypothetical protein [Mycolicibacter acidiphilus]MBS9533099.1 hypothetical protein [Mycolicibacter acidiphilus]